VQIKDLLKTSCETDSNGIWCDRKLSINPAQANEHKYRTSYANYTGDDCFENLSNYYSIQVMDSEISSVLQRICNNGVIVDIGGAWGWHWRTLSKQSKDVAVLIVDFVYENLIQANNLLKKFNSKNVHLLHADATELPIKNEVVDLVWAVQSFQHIPNIDEVLNQVHRTLKKGGELRSYDFNYRFSERIIYSLLNKEYLEESFLDSYFLRRSGMILEKAVQKVFNSKIKHEYTEILFQPNFKIKYKNKSLAGAVDVLLSGSRHFGAIARQKTTICIKN